MKQSIKQINKVKKINNLNIDAIYKILAKETPKWNTPVAELMQIQTKDPFKVLVTTILSARTNDKITLLAAQRLFEKIILVGGIVNV